MNLKSVYDAACDLFFPPRCMLCLDVIPLGEPKWICAACAGLLARIEEPACVRCGAGPLSNTEHKTCADCAKKELHGFLNGNRAVFIYDDMGKRLVHNFKYANHPEIAEGIAAYFFNEEDLNFLRGADCIAYVPLHRRRQNKRGYNQAECLAREMSKASGVPARNLLARGRDTSPQSSLDYFSRMRNMEGAFKINKKFGAAYKKIIVADDIYTTGATLNACAEALKNAGADAVYGFTAAITVKD